MFSMVQVVHMHCYEHVGGFNISNFDIQSPIAKLYNFTKLKHYTVVHQTLIENGKTLL